MLIKVGVDISRLRPEIRKKLSMIEGEYKQIAQELVITSTFEGNHSAGSLHYANLAVDIRRPPDGLHYAIANISNALGPNYDVVTESDHIHIEYDPKPPAESFHLAKS